MRGLTWLERLEARLPDAFDLRWALAATGAAFAAGIVFALWTPQEAHSPPRPSEPPEVEALAAEVARLEAALAAKGREGEQQSAELAHLRSLLAELETLRAGVGAPPSVGAPAPPRAAVARRIPSPPPLPEDARFDEGALLASGLAPGDAERVHEAWQRAETTKRELSERATAEGWEHSYRHVREVRDIDAALRRDLDDQAYDGLLYATGRPNRLVVREVVADSPAQRAGVQPGDRILRYDGQRVFSSAELHAAAVARSRSRTVRLEIERGGELVSVVVPREPLGVLAKLTRAPPVSP